MTASNNVVPNTASLDSLAKQREVRNAWNAIQQWKASQNTRNPLSYEYGLNAVLRLYKYANISSLSLLLGHLINLRGKPLTLENHFTHEPLFERFNVPNKMLLKCGRQLGKCYKSLSLLHLHSGKVVLGKDIKVGDKVLSIDKDFNVVTQTVTNIFNNGVQEVLTIKTRTGSELTITPNHKLKTLYGYTQAKDLKVGDRIPAITVGGEFLNKPMDRDRIILTAYMIGDGSCVNPERTNFTTGSEEIKDEFTQVASKYQAYPVKYSYRTPNCIQFRIKLDNKLNTWLIQDGLMGHYSYDKFIPDWVFELSREDTILFLSRLWATDGSIKTYAGGPSITYCSTSKRVIKAVRALLLKLGIFSCIRQKEAGYRDDNGDYVRCKDAYELRIEGYDSWKIFLEQIKVPSKPAIELPTTGRNSNRDTIPIEIREALARLCDKTKGKHGIVGKNGQLVPSLRQTGLRMTCKYPPSVGKLQEYIDYFDKFIPDDNEDLILMKNLAKGTLYWDEITEITPAEKCDTLDMEVSGEHNYILDGIVSHNSVALAAQGIIQSALTPHFNTLYICPLYEQIRRFSSNYVRPMIQDSPVKDLLTGDMLGAQNVLQRTFANNSIMFFTFCFLDVERVRGISCDAIKIDEVQDIDWDFLPIIRHCMSASMFGTEQYSGTPKTFENTIQVLWDDSSQGEWVIPCSCGYWNTCTVQADLDKMVQRQGLSCAKCGKLVDSRQGHYEHMRPDRRNSFAGYHVPQPILPIHYNVPNKWYNIFIQREKNQVAYYNECLGESRDAGTKLVSITDLQKACKLPWHNTIAEALEERPKYEHVTMGVDWGGGAGGIVKRKKGAIVVEGGSPSFTVITICGFKYGDVLPHLLYAERLSSMLTPQQEIEIIIKYFRMFNCYRLAHDFGGSGAIREAMLFQAGFPSNNVFPCQYVRATSKNICVYQPPISGGSRFFYSIDKARSLALLCTLVKAERGITFPKCEWGSGELTTDGKFELILRDFLALIEDKHESIAGSDVYLITRNPKQPDDFCHSLNYACISHWHSTRAYPSLAQEYGIPLTAAQTAELDPNPTLADWGEN